jgi:hypothetical protein
MPGGRRFFTTGPAYSDGLIALKRPICPNSGYLTLSFKLMTDLFTSELAQALEFDTRISVSQLNYNLSSQFNYQEGGTFQIVNSKGTWVDTGYNPGKFQPYLWYPVTLAYGFDLAAKAFSFLSVNVGLGAFQIPKALQNIPAEPLAWEDTCNLQVQLDLAATGGSYSIYLSQINYSWE